MCNTAQTTKRSNNIANLHETLSYSPMIEIANFNLPSELKPPIFEYYRGRNTKEAIIQHKVNTVRGLDLPPFAVEYSAKDSFDFADIPVSNTWQRPLIALQLWLNGFRSECIENIAFSNDLVNAYDATTLDSCMAGEGVFFKSLTGTEQLYIAQSGNLGFRVLIWFDHINKIAFTDRVYYRSERRLTDIYLSLFELLTSKYTGYEIRVKNQFAPNDSYKLVGNFYEMCNYAQLTEGLKFTFEIRGKYMPYMDTFFKMSRNKSLTEFWLTADKGKFSLLETNGKISDNQFLSNDYEEETEICDSCGCRGYLDDLIYSNYAGVFYCEDCAVYCEDIGDYTYSDNTVWLEYRDCYVLTINCTEVADRYIRERIGAYIANEDLYL